MQEEINLLSANYKELQNKSLENSPLFKELTYLANKNKPRNDKPLITEKQWKLITDEITQIYQVFINTYIVYVRIYQNKTFNIAVFTCMGSTLTLKQNY